MSKAGEVSVRVFQHIREVLKGVVLAAFFAARGTHGVWFAELVRNSGVSVLRRTRSTSLYGIPL